MFAQPSFSDLNTAHWSLVNIPSQQMACGSDTLVVPFEPESSVLWKRIRPMELDDGQWCGPKMPYGGGGLSISEALVVYDWIAAGAPI